MERVGYIGLMMWSVLYWVLLSIAVLLLLRGLLWDRAGFRGRAKRRCRKCWYDLTGIFGDVTKGPVVCPECGKGHKTVRSMRKTRRGKRWVVAAVVVWLLAYGASVTPNVQQRGWMAAIPEPVMVLTIPFADGSAGSSFDQTMWGYKVNPTVWDQLIREHGRRGWNQPRSWVADRLVFLLARFESRDVITDSTTDRGALYAFRISMMINRGRAYWFEEDWARAVVYAEFHTPERIVPGTTIFGELKIRRLVQSVYRVDVGHNVAWFEARTRGDAVSLGGGGAGGGPGISSIGEYIQLQQWDRLERMPRIPHGESSTGEMMVSRYKLNPMATGVQNQTVPVTLYDQFGDPRLSVTWEEVVSTNVPFSFVADSDAGPEIVEDAKLADLIDSYIDAELGFRFDRESSSWKLVASLTNDEFQLEQSVTFGGEVSIEVQHREGQKISYKRLMREPKKWWRWDPPTRPPEDMDENSREYWELWREGQLTPSGGAWGVAFQEGGSSVQLKNSDGRLVLRVRTEDSDLERIVFADPKAKRVLMGELVFPIKDWTIEELNRYRIGGVIPEQAMP